MKIGRGNDGTKCRRGGNHSKTMSPIRVTMIGNTPSTTAIAFRFAESVVTEARWKIGDRLVPDFDEHNGTFRLSRVASGWSLSKARRCRSYTLKLKISDSAVKEFQRFVFPADVYDYIEDGGDLVFDVERKSQNV